MKVFLFSTIKWISNHKNIVAIFLIIVYVLMLFVPMYTAYEWLSGERTTYHIGTYFDIKSISYFNDLLNNKPDYYPTELYDSIQEQLLSYSLRILPYFLFLVVGIVLFFALYKRKHRYIPIIFIPQILTYLILLFLDSAKQTYFTSIYAPTGIFYPILIGVLSAAYYVLEKYFAKHPVEAPPPRQPRPRKPTQAERIAELERQVEELKNNQK